jgi:hypothetical protein
VNELQKRISKSLHVRIVSAEETTPLLRHGMEMSRGWDWHRGK